MISKRSMINKFIRDGCVNLMAAHLAQLQLISGPSQLEPDEIESIDELGEVIQKTQKIWDAWDKGN